MVNLFVSYALNVKPEQLIFMLQVTHFLCSQGIQVFFWAVKGEKNPKWATILEPAIQAAQFFLFFRTEQLGATQIKEAQFAHNCTKNLFMVNLTNQPNDELAEKLIFQNNIMHVALPGSDPRQCAQLIVKKLSLSWVCDDDLPSYETIVENGSVIFPFKHEKDIIQAYLANRVSPKTLAGRRLIFQGCPLKWPTVSSLKEPMRDTLVDPNEVGGFRPEGEDARFVLGQCLSRFDSGKLIAKNITFAEAGARKAHFHHPIHPLGGGRAMLSCAIVVSGGIAPAINAVIAGIVERHCLYANRDDYALRILGFKNGFLGFGLPVVGAPHIKELVVNQNRTCHPHDDVTAHANEGGSLLGTSRLPDFVRWSPEELALLGRAHGGKKAGDPKTPAEYGKNLEHIVNEAQMEGIQILYVIGGDGSMKAAHALAMTSKAKGIKLSVVGIPKTMDNDILWVWASFGFQSAVQQSTEVIRQLWTEASSNPRLCVVQLFGSDSGFVVTDAAAASGHCDLFLTPETPFRMEVISEILAKKLMAGDRSHAVVVMAESAVPVDVDRYTQDLTQASMEDRELIKTIGLTPAERDALNQYHHERRLIGQTPDDLRSGALKVVSRVLQHNLKHHPAGRWRTLRVFTNEPRHLIRAIPPSSSDIISARRFGFLAVDGAMAGFEDFMISWWLTEYVMVPLPLVVLGRKRIPTNGAFHAAARASTGQPPKLD